MLTLRDLFQVVFEMKKKEVEEAKRKREASISDSSEPSTPAADKTQQSADNQANVRFNTHLYLFYLLFILMFYNTAYIFFPILRFPVRFHKLSLWSGRISPAALILFCA